MFLGYGALCLGFGSRVQGLRGLGLRGSGFRGLGFRGLGFKLIKGSRDVLLGLYSGHCKEAQGSTGTTLVPISFHGVIWEKSCRV